jgi:hypothetical protein
VTHETSAKDLERKKRWKEKRKGEKVTAFFETTQVKGIAWCGGGTLAQRTEHDFVKLENPTFVTKFGMPVNHPVPAVAGSPQPRCGDCGHLSCTAYGRQAY